MSVKASCREVRQGFTLVELLVVIAIIGILVGLLLPAVQTAREAARRSNCSNNIRQVALAVANHHDAKNAFPTEGAASGFSNYSWLCYVLPYMEEQAVYDSMRGSLSKTGNYAASNTTKGFGTKKIGSFLCPSATFDRSGSTGDQPPQTGGFSGNAYTTHYYGSAGPLVPSNALYPFNCGFGLGGLACEGIMPMYRSDLSGGLNCSSASSIPWTGVPNDWSGNRIKDILDGTSKTLMLLEISWVAAQPQLRSWLKGTQWSGGAGAHRNIRYDMLLTSNSTQYNNTSIGSQHPAGCNVAFGDCSVRFLSSTVDFNGVLKGLSSRAGGEQIAFDRVE
jgi:prepilin-type N-terminal cleavage/methylation domain-containing protein